MWLVENACPILWFNFLETQYFQCVVSIQAAITCLKLTIETLKQGVKYVQS